MALDNYKYPVDAVLIGQDRSVLGHVNVHEPEALIPGLYADFLKDGLAAAGRKPVVSEGLPREYEDDSEAGGPAPPMTRLTPEAPTATISGSAEYPADGGPVMKFHNVDATAFENGGTVVVEVKVGSGLAHLMAELCAPQEMPPGLSVSGGDGDGSMVMFAPVRESGKLAPGAVIRLEYAIDKGSRLGFAVKIAAGSKAGESNTWSATLTMEPNRNGGPHPRGPGGRE